MCASIEQVQRGKKTCFWNKASALMPYTRPCHRFGQEVVPLCPFPPASRSSRQHDNCVIHSSSGFPVTLAMRTALPQTLELRKVSLSAEETLAP